ncbi:23S rRNA (cytidine2498-2'-O)-methyltransferase [Azospirillaceae bacterium]
MITPEAVPFGQTLYLAPEGYADVLRDSLGPDAVEIGPRLIAAPGPARFAPWAQNIWFDPVRLSIPSIKAGVRALRALQRNWALWSIACHRRAALIESQLPLVSARPLIFPEPAPTAPLGSWTLLDAETILAASRCSSPFRHGEAAFVEDRQKPPNRAYLKLWEALTLAQRRPGPGDLCVDLGASPGGWTWVMQTLGARVIAIDKAPLAPEIAALPRIESRRESAFAIAPTDIGPVDWLCSDVICYPDRLLRMVQNWRDSRLARNMIVSIKFQGATDHNLVGAFAALPNSRLVHLSHNKHELTWISLSEQDAGS